MKSMLPKQKSYIPRFALIINTINAFENDENMGVISKESILAAEKLSKYFIAMAKKIKVNSSEVNKIKKVIRKNDELPIKEQFIMLYKANPNLNKKEVSELLGVSRRYIYNLIKELE
jgi:DNA-directed RNA polymerase specialized sigma subunit